MGVIHHKLLIYNFDGTSSFRQEMTKGEACLGKHGWAVGLLQVSFMCCWTFWNNFGYIVNLNFDFRIDFYGRGMSVD